MDDTGMQTLSLAGVDNKWDVLEISFNKLPINMQQRFGVDQCYSSISVL